MVSAISVRLMLHALADDFCAKLGQSRLLDVTNRQDLCTIFVDSVGEMIGRW